MTAPQWMDRPSGPGMWVSIPEPDAWPSPIVMYLTEEDIESGVPFHSQRVYGPIPPDVKEEN